MPTLIDGVLILKDFISHTVFGEARAAARAAHIKYAVAPSSLGLILQELERVGILGPSLGAVLQQREQQPPPQPAPVPKQQPALAPVPKPATGKPFKGDQYKTMIQRMTQIIVEHAGDREFGVADMNEHLPDFTISQRSNGYRLMNGAGILERVGYGRYRLINPNMDLATLPSMRALTLKARTIIKRNRKPTVVATLKDSPPTAMPISPKTPVLPQGSNNGGDVTESLPDKLRDLAQRLLGLATEVEQAATAVEQHNTTIAAKVRAKLQAALQGAFE